MKKQELAEENQRLKDQIAFLRAADTRRSTHCACLSLDLWPASDWLRFRWSGYNPGKYFQVCVGPIRFDFWED